MNRIIGQLFEAIFSTTRNKICVIIGSNDMITVIKNNLYMVHKIFQYCPMYIVLKIVLSLISNLATAMNIYYLKWIIDAIDENNLMTVIIIVTFSTAVGVLISVVTVFFSSRFDPIYTQIMQTKMRQEIYNCSGPAEIAN